MRKLGYPKEATPEDVEKFNTLRKSLPDLAEGSLGTCAIVANSDNLLKSQRGKEIDAHDTVFRHNTPTRGFEKNVGKKTGIVIGEALTAMPCLRLIGPLHSATPDCRALLALDWPVAFSDS